MSSAELLIRSEWEAAPAGSAEPSFIWKSPLVVMPGPVEQFLRALSVRGEELDDATRVLRELVRSGDKETIERLISIAGDPAEDAEGRTLALEVLTGALPATSEQAVIGLVETFLDAADDVLRFAALACLVDLPREHRERLTETVRGLASPAEPDEDVRRSAASYLRLFVDCHGSTP